MLLEGFTSLRKDKLVVCVSFFSLVLSKSEEKFAMCFLVLLAGFDHLHLVVLPCL